MHTNQMNTMPEFTIAIHAGNPANPSASTAPRGLGRAHPSQAWTLAPSGRFHQMGRPLARILVLLGVISLAQAATPQPLSFELLAKTTVKEPPSTAVHKGLESLRGGAADESQSPVFPDELRKLDGKRVSLSGFVIPYADPDKMSKMMLTKAPVGCFFCNPPKENGVVFVRLAATEKPINMDSETITVEGTLRLVQPAGKDEEAQQFFFTIDDAKVTKSTPNQ